MQLISCQIKQEKRKESFIEIRGNKQCDDMSLLVEHSAVTILYVIVHFIVSDITNSFHDRWLILRGNRRKIIRLNRIISLNRSEWRFHEGRSTLI